MKNFKMAYHHQPFNFILYSSKVLSNVVMLWLYYLFCICLIINIKSDFIMVYGAYSEADDLINELDRPSKFNLNFFLIMI